LKVHQGIDFDVVEEHLRAMRSGVRLRECALPGDRDEYRSFRVELELADLPKLVLWWEFERHTTDQNCRLATLLPSAATLERLEKCSDLRIIRNRELVLLADDLQGSFLYIIDGNHRAIAQHLYHGSFEGVSAYVCVYPGIRAWAYVTRYYKRRWGLP
jgi:hypothetical protein